MVSAWAGLCNTQFWVDRSTGVCASIYSNFLPFCPEAVQMYTDFEKALTPGGPGRASGSGVILQR